MQFKIIMMRNSQINWREKIINKPIARERSKNDGEKECSHSRAHETKRKTYSWDELFFSVWIILIHITIIFHISYLYMRERDSKMHIDFILDSALVHAVHCIHGRRVGERREERKRNKQNLCLFNGHHCILGALFFSFFFFFFLYYLASANIFSVLLFFLSCVYIKYI